MPVIALEAVGFHFESPFVPVFHDLELRIDTGWRTGLVGRNGRGKSTLLGLIEGRLRPQQGRVVVPVEAVAFAAGDDVASGSTREHVRESVAPFGRLEHELERLAGRDDPASLARYGQLSLELERLGAHTIDHRLDEEWSALGCAPELLDRPVATLSGGERTRAAIVALFLRRGGYPLLDEPTHCLDREGRERLGHYLERKRGFLLVSHDRALLDRCCDHVVALEPSGPRVHAGDYSSLRRQQQIELEHEERARAGLTREIRDLERAARERRQWSDARERAKIGAFDKGFEGRRAAKIMKRALHSERRASQKLDEKRSLLRVPDKPRALAFVRGASSDPVLVAEDVTVAVAGRTLVEHFDLVLRPGERVALTGRNGCGKTLLLETLAGERMPARGRVTVGRGDGVQHAHQQPRWREGPLAQHLRALGQDQTRFRQLLGALGFEGEGSGRPLESLSQGERRKAELARSFAGPAALFVWDEPLEGLDIETRERLEQAILRDRPTLLFVEHDAWFVERVATRTIRLD